MSFNLVPNADHYWRLNLESIKRHTHNTFLLNCRFPPGNFLSPPPGAHVFLRRKVGGVGGAPANVASSNTATTSSSGSRGKLVSRPYTPIHPSFDDGKLKNHDGEREADTDRDRQSVSQFIYY